MFFFISKQKHEIFTHCSRLRVWPRIQKQKKGTGTGYQFPPSLADLSRLQTSKFSYDKFYLPSARVYMQHILYDKFSYDKFYFTGVNVSTSFLWQVFFVDPVRRAKFVLWQFFLWQVHLFKHASFWASAFVIEKIVKVARTDEQIKLVT